MNPIKLLAAMVMVMLAASRADAADFLVVTATFKSQDEAQAFAARSGGWTLDTDAYSALEPNRFAVVRGPFAKRSEAERELRTLARQPRYKSAYVKEAGTLRLPKNLVAAAVPPKVLAALLGELSITVADHPGSENPCEPQEPYQSVSVTYLGLERTAAGEGGAAGDPDGVAPARRNLELGGLWIVKRTGEIQLMRICLE